MAQRPNLADYDAAKMWIRPGDELARNVPIGSAPVAVKILLYNVDVVYCQNREILQMLHE